jgi:hypothetical protein
MLCILGIFTYQINKLGKSLEQAEQKVAILEQQLKDSDFELAKVKANISLLDSAVNADTKRRVRIVKVRNIIREEMVKIKPKTVIGPLDLGEFAASVVDNCDKFGVPVPLFLSLIKAESGFEVHALSPAGAQGLSQIMPSTAEDIKGWLGKTYYDPYKITHNIQFGSYYLSKMLTKFHYNKERAIWAYNTGEVYVQRYLSGEYKELEKQTIEYQKKVSEYEKDFELRGAS